MADAAAPKPDNSKFSFSIWPPSQRIRDAVVVRLSETLSSSDSILSNSNLYQPVPADEASSAARVIEDQAFSAADVSSVADGDVDGKIETLSVYAKEISKRALEMLKSRAAQVTTEGLPSVN